MRRAELASALGVMVAGGRIQLPPAAVFWNFEVRVNGEGRISKKMSSADRPLETGTIQLPSACNEQIAPIYVSERGIYAASTPNHPVTSKNSIGIAFGTVKRHKCRAPAASHLNRSG